MGERPEKSADALRPLSWPHLAAVVLPIIFAVLYGIWAKHNYQNYYGKLDSLGVDTKATIIAKYMGTSGNIRSRSYYEMKVEFPVDDKTRRGSIRVTRGFYNSYDPPDTVLVRYLPDNSQIREMDPGMRRKSLRNTYTIIAISLFIGLANIFALRGERHGQRRVKEKKSEGRNMKHSRKLMPVIAFGLAFANAWATGIDKANASQDCVEKVQAMFKGVWNPFARPPYRSVKTVYDSADKVLRVFDSIVQSPLRTISGVRNNGYFALVVDSNVWTGPSLEGPWGPSQGLPTDRKKKIMRAHQFMIDGIQSAQCAQKVVLDGKELEKYVYKVKTAADKKQGGFWLAAANIIYFDPAAERIVRWEKSEMQSSWAPEVSPTREVTVFSYDGEIKVDAPN